MSFQLAAFLFCCHIPRVLANKVCGEIFGKSRGSNVFLMLFYIYIYFFLSTPVTFWYLWVYCARSPGSHRILSHFFLHLSTRQSALVIRAEGTFQPTASLFIIFFYHFSALSLSLPLFPISLFFYFHFHFHSSRCSHSWHFLRRRSLCHSSCSKLEIWYTSSRIRPFLRILSRR